MTYRYVETGLDITITWTSDVPPGLARKLVWISLADELPRTAFGLVTRTGSYLSLPVRRFAELVVESVPGSLPSAAVPSLESSEKR